MLIIYGFLSKTIGFFLWKHVKTISVNKMVRDVSYIAIIFNKPLSRLEWMSKVVKSRCLTLWLIWKDSHAWPKVEYTWVTRNKMLLEHPSALKVGRRQHNKIVCFLNKTIVNFWSSTKRKKNPIWIKVLIPKHH